MGRAPCCEKDTVKRGPWTPEEDAKLLACVAQHGTGSWRTLPNKAGLQRCGKSCRLRWTNYLRPDLNHGRFSEQEEQTIVKLHAALGSRWSLIAAQLPGRTDNDVKNYWNTRLKKKLCEMGIDPITHKPISQLLADLAGSMASPTLAGSVAIGSGCRTIADAALSCFKDDMLNVIMRRHPANLDSAVAALPPHPAAAASCSSSPAATAAPDRRHPLEPFFQYSPVSRRQGTFQPLPPPSAAPHLPTCVRFLKDPPPPSASIITQQQAAHQQKVTLHQPFTFDEQHSAKSMMEMLVESNNRNHHVTSATTTTATLVSGLAPTFHRSNEVSSLKILASVQFEQTPAASNYSLSTLSERSAISDPEKALTQAKPWLADDYQDHDQSNTTYISHSNEFNWAEENASSSSMHIKSRTDMPSWSPTCTSRSSSTCSNLPGTDPNYQTLSTMADHGVLSSVDALLWDLSDLNALIP